MPGDQSRPAWKSTAPSAKGRGPRYGWKPQDEAGAPVHLWRRRFQMAGQTLENEVVADRLLLTYSLAAC